MGKVPRQIARIGSLRDRKITFNKRYAGVLKKIYELGVLCDQDIFFFVRDQSTHTLRMFSTKDENFIPDYSSIKQEYRKGSRDVQHHYHKKSKTAPSVHYKSPVDTCPRHNEEPNKALSNSLMSKGLPKVGEHYNQSTERLHPASQLRSIIFHRLLSQAMDYGQALMQLRSV